MDLSKHDVYTVGVKEFEADTIQLKNKIWTNEHRRKLQCPGIFSIKLDNKCLLVGSSKSSVGSYALGYFRKKSSYSFWIKEYLREMLDKSLSGEIEFLLCKASEIKELKLNIQKKYSPILLSELTLSQSDEDFLKKHFSEVVKTQEFCSFWGKRGIYEIESLQDVCESRFELLNRLLTEMLNFCANERKQFNKKIVDEAFSDLIFGKD